jgi:hypothetical protein
MIFNDGCHNPFIGLNEEIQSVKSPAFMEIGKTFTFLLGNNSIIIGKINQYGCDILHEYPPVKSGG